MLGLAGSSDRYPLQDVSESDCDATETEKKVQLDFEVCLDSSDSYPLQNVPELDCDATKTEKKVPLDFELC